MGLGSDKIYTLCFGLVFVIHTSFVFSKSVLKCSLCLPYILLGALLAPQQIYNVVGGAIYTTVDVSLVVIRCCFHSFPLLDIRTDTISVVPSLPGSFLFALVLFYGGTLDLMSFSLILGGLL